MIPVTQRLIEESNTRKLATKERRQAVVFIRSTNPEVTNTEMAEQFGVSERTIRQDLQAFRREKAQFIKDDDVGLIIADIALDYERQLRDIERSKAKAKIGSLTFLKHCTDAMELRFKCVKALQDLGYYPKNLGNMTVQKFDFKAIVNKLDGSVTVHNRDLIDEPKLIEASFEDSNGS
jgi:DeoR/GlpR family transcriptional regulator of sugar metabolism